MDRSRVRAGLAGGLLACGFVVYLLAFARHGESRRPAPATASATIQAGTFTAAVPAGWSVTERIAKGGAIGYHLSSTGRPISGLGIGPTGTAGITISESGTKALSSGTLAGRPARSYSPTGLLPFLVGQPAGAVSVVRAEAPTARTLAGQPSGEESFSYGYEGRKVIQADLLLKRSGHIVMVELDTEPALASSSETALQGLFASWRWS